MNLGRYAWPHQYYSFYSNLTFYNTDFPRASQSMVSRVVTYVNEVLSTPEMIQQYTEFPRTREEFLRTSLEFH